MDDHSPTMGVGIAVFLGLWAVMMVAMMLPTIGRVSVVYVDMIRRSRDGRRPATRVAALAAGYVLVWTAIGVPAYGAAYGMGLATDRLPGAAPWIAAGLLATAGLFQYTRFKERCLDHCRSPLAYAAQFGNRSGRLADVTAGIVHGAYCSGCCAGLMLVLVAVATMLWMAILAVVVLLEKTWRHGKRLGRLAGATIVVYAAFVPAYPGLVTGVTPAAPYHRGAAAATVAQPTISGRSGSALHSVSDPS